MLMERSLGRVLGYVSDGLGRAERSMPRRIGVAIGIAQRPWTLPQAALRKWFGDRDGTAGTQGGALRLSKSIAISRSPDELYAFWRRLENLPRIMTHLQSVEARDHQRSHWVARLPGGAKLEWDAEITREEPDERLAWRSLPGSALTHTGSVEFKGLPGRRGTSVTVELWIEANEPLRDSVATLLGEWPEITLGNDLRRLKQLMETGEVATTEGQPSGKRSIVSRHLP
jgi:uncharacterized membrane protein